MMTIGHSTLPLEVFLQALKDNGCRLLVDVRSIPRSRHNPQFGQEALFASLEAAGIAAVWRRGPRWPQTRAERQHQPWLEERKFSRLRGLHADAGVRQSGRLADGFAES